MLVSQCDRCGKLPVETKWTQREPIEGKYAVEFTVSLQALSSTSRKQYPDICEDCFWNLVRRAIKEPVTP